MSSVSACGLPGDVIELQRLRRVLQLELLVDRTIFSGFGFFASASGTMVCGRVMALWKNGSVLLCATTPSPSDTAARTPPE